MHEYGKAHAKAKEAYKKKMKGDRYKPGKAYTKGKKGLGMRKKATSGKMEYDNTKLR